MPRGVAHVGAVEVEPYAAGKRLRIVLAEAGVGAGGAALAQSKQASMHSTSVEASTVVELGLVWSIWSAWVTRRPFYRVQPLGTYGYEGSWRKGPRASSE